MPTTVHIPDDLLAQVDARARAMKIARNRYIVEALRNAVREQKDWPPEFLTAIRKLKPIEGVDEFAAAIRATRSRKAAPKL